MGAFNPYAGKSGRITINGANQNLSSWEIDSTSEDLDTTNFESPSDAYNVYSTGLTGINDTTIVIRGPFDGGNNPTGAPAILYPGATGVGSFYYAKGGIGFSNVAFRVLNIGPTTAVRGKIGEFSARIKVNGLFYQAA